MKYIPQYPVDISLGSASYDCSTSIRFRRAASRPSYPQALVLRLARRQWKYVQNYADAKSEVVEGIIARARAERSGP